MQGRPCNPRCSEKLDEIRCRNPSNPRRLAESEHLLQLAGGKFGFASRLFLLFWRTVFRSRRFLIRTTSKKAKSLLTHRNSLIDREEVPKHIGFVWKPERQTFLSVAMT